MVFRQNDIFPYSLYGTLTARYSMSEQLNVGQVLCIPPYRESALPK